MRPKEVDNRKKIEYKLYRSCRCSDLINFDGMFKASLFVVQNINWIILKTLGCGKLSFMELVLLSLEPRFVVKLRFRGES